MEKLGFYNGKYGSLEDMTVPMNDRGCFFGDGVYDATYSSNYIIFNLDAHIERFYKSASQLEIKIPYSKDKMKSILNEMVSKMDTGENFVYWQATRGTQVRQHSFPSDMQANIWIIIKPDKIRDLSKKVKLITLEDTRYFHCNIKTINLIPSVIAAQRTVEAGCDEAIFHRGEYVTECAHSNVHIIENGVFRTAPTDNLILPGIARANILKACKAKGVPVSETPFTVKEMMDADEVIVSSSGSLFLVASEVNSIPVGGKAPEIVKMLQDHLLDEFIKETTPRAGG